MKGYGQSHVHVLHTSQQLVNFISVYMYTLCTCGVCIYEPWLAQMLCVD